MSAGPCWALYTDGAGYMVRYLFHLNIISSKPRGERCRPIYKHLAAALLSVVLLAKLQGLPITSFMQKPSRFFWLPQEENGEKKRVSRKITTS